MNLPHINTQSEQTVIKSFESIARELIRNRKIQVNNCKFSFIDLEFYLYDDQHKELYNQDHVSRPFGELEIHGQGVDISLNDQGLYGGIFIRRLYDEQNNCSISKSKVIRTLYNQIKMGHNDIQMIEEATPWKEIFMTIRKTSDSTDLLHNTAYTQKRYRFMAKDQEISKNVEATKKGLTNTPIWRIKKLETI